MSVGNTGDIATEVLIQSEHALQKDSLCFPENVRMNFSCFMVIGKPALLAKYVPCVEVSVSSPS